MNGRNNTPHDPRLEQMIRQQMAESIAKEQRGQQGPMRVQMPPQFAQLPVRVEELADIVHVLTEMVEAVLPEEMVREMANRLDALAEQRHIEQLPRTPIVLWSTERLVPEVVAAVDKRVQVDGETRTEQCLAHLFVAPDSPLQHLHGKSFIEAEMGKALHAASSKVLAEKTRAHRAGKYTDEQLRPCEGDAPLPPQLAERVKGVMADHAGDFSPAKKIEIVKP